MRDYIEERAIHIAQYIVDNGATVRQTARQFGVSKSTVHKDVTQRLIQINPRLAFQTRIILDINKSERHIRGGMATREKYRHHTQDVTFSSNIHAPCGNTEYSDTHSKDSEFPQVPRRLRLHRAYLWKRSAKCWDINGSPRPKSTPKSPMTRSAGIWRR